MKSAHFSNDIQEFLYLLFKNQVKYVIIGGETVPHYALLNISKNMIKLALIVIPI